MHGSVCLSYTHFSTSKTVHRRIDFILVNKHCIQYIRINGIIKHIRI